MQKKTQLFEYVLIKTSFENIGKDKAEQSQQSHSLTKLEE